MIVTTKKLEIIFVIVYFVIAIFCIVFSNIHCLIGSFFGALVGILDWYVIKFMSKRWLRRGGYSFFENSLRFLFIGFSIWILFRAKISIIGIVLGLSVVPASIVAVTVIVMINNKNTTV